MPDPELELQVDELCLLDTNREPTETELYDIYCWVDSLEFSKQKKNMTRDFSDGVLLAEVIAHYLPQYVNVRSFTTALSKKNKIGNWDHLTTKVFSKLGFKVDKKLISDVMDSKPGAIEKVLFDLRPVLARRNRSILNYRVGQKVEASQPRKPVPPTTPTFLSTIRQVERVPKTDIFDKRPPSLARSITPLPAKRTVDSLNRRPSSKSTIVSKTKIPQTPIPTKAPGARPVTAKSRKAPAPAPVEVQAEPSKSDQQFENPVPLRILEDSVNQESSLQILDQLERPKAGEYYDKTSDSMPLPLLLRDGNPGKNRSKPEEPAEALFDISANDVHLVEDDDGETTNSLPPSKAPTSKNKKNPQEHWTKPTSSFSSMSPEELVLSGNVSKSQIKRTFGSELCLCGLV